MVVIWLLYHIDFIAGSLLPTKNSKDITRKKCVISTQLFFPSFQRLICSFFRGVVTHTTFVEVSYIACY